MIWEKLFNAVYRRSPSTTAWNQPIADEVVVAYSLDHNVYTR